MSWKKNHSSPGTPICPVFGLVSRICPDLPISAAICQKLAQIFCIYEKLGGVWSSALDATGEAHYASSDPNVAPYELWCPNYGYLILD